MLDMTPEDWEIVDSDIKQIEKGILSSLHENPEIRDAIASIKRKGYKMKLIIEAHVAVGKDEGQLLLAAPEPFVQNGQIRAGVYISDDDVFLRELKISLDDKPRP